MKLTTNYGLKKPEGSDVVNVEDFNENADIIDVELKRKANKTEMPTSLPANGGDADTVNGHTVNSDVPAGAKFSDTVYSHPAAHPASMITESTTKRFVSDTEKTAWNGKADGSHNHNASNINAGTLPLTRGGTGQTSGAAVRNALGLGNTTGALPVANGGTGSTTATNARTAIGAAPLASPTFTGTAKGTANTSYTTTQFRNIRFGTSEPSSLANGEIYFMYE